MYTRQHKKTGLQSPYEGPFKIHERLTRSTFKIEVGNYQSGEPRFEVRHINDLKLAHPDSMAAEAKRPKLGRPTVQPGSSVPADATSQSNSSRSVSKPSATSSQSHSPRSKSPTKTNDVSEKIQTAFDTLSGKPPHPDYIKKGPIITNQMFDDANWPQILKIPESSRPIRASRNPNPRYVDAISFGPPPQLGFPRVQPTWSASSADLAEINKWISRSV